MIEGKRWTVEELRLRKEKTLPLFDYFDAPGREVRIFYGIKKMHQQLDQMVKLAGPDAGYRRLAVAVLMRAVVDYFNPDSSKADRRSATEFLLFNRDPDTLVWFEILGLNPAVVKRYIQEIEREPR